MEEKPLRSKPKKKKPKEQLHVFARGAANGAPNSAKLIVPLDGLKLLQTLKGHTGWVTSTAWSPDGKQIASSSCDNTIRLWNATADAPLHTLKGHTSIVRSVVWSPDGKRLASGSDDGTVLLWDPTTRVLLHTLKAHTAAVFSVAWSPDGKRLASSSADNTIRLWDLTTEEPPLVLEGYMGAVRSVAWSPPDGKRLASGSDDNTIRLWDSTHGKLLSILDDRTSAVKDSTGLVRSVAWSPDGKQLASGSRDRTVRLWNANTGTLLHTLEGHQGEVESVTWSPDGRLLVSSSDIALSYSDIALSYRADIYIWRADTWESLAELTGLTGFMCSAWHPNLPLLATVGQQKYDIAVWQLNLEYLLGVAASPETVHYTNARVMLVGDSGVGKSGLGLVLSGQPFTVTESTHSRRVWNFDRQEVSFGEEGYRETRETLLWDLAGQPGYRLIHQLHLNEVAVALVIFDAHSETDPFAGVRYWNRALVLAQSVQGGSALPLKKFLVAARTDRGGVGVSSERIQAIIEELGFDGYFATSAKEGWQVDELRAAICQAIDWQVLPKVSSTVLFHQIKQFLLDEKQRARQLISSVEDLYNMFLCAKDAPVETSELPVQFETCIRHAEAAGLIKRLSFGKLVLLQLEFLDAYASALVNVVKEEPDGLGCIAEEEVRTGAFRIPADERMLDAEQEKLLLIAMIEDLLRRELVLREEGMLVFPSQSTKENPNLPDPEGKAVVFELEGPILNIYATLAVRLARSGLFKKQDLWKNAITYTTVLGGGICGVHLHNLGEGRGDLTLFFDQVASRETRHTFTEYVHQHLLRRALPVRFNIRYVLICQTCEAIISDNNIRLRKARNFNWLDCPVCGTRVSLVEREQQFTAAPSSHTKQMNQAADQQREREAAQLTLQGKIATGDFDVFFCYQNLDRSIVEQIGEQLKEQGILPWLDVWEVRPGLSWQRYLQKQIKQIKSAAVFVGKNGIGPWQQLELEAFLREFAKRGCPVIPVLLKDARKKPRLPLFLEGMTWVDFRLQDSDPLQKLVWGITGRRDLDKEGYH